MIKITTASSPQTKKLASTLAREILKTPPSRGAFVIALEGNLGSGKTTFVQGFARGLGIKEIPKSPTFVLMNIFPMRQETQDTRHRVRQLVHIDCYRIAAAKELKHLGVQEIFKDPHAIVVIEWAERIKNILPKNAIHIKFSHGKKSNQRILQISYSW